MNMNRLFSTIALCAVSLVVSAQKVASPNGNLKAATTDQKLVISYKNQKALDPQDLSVSG